MTATPALTTDLQRQVLLLEDDLRERVAADFELEGRWKQEHQRAVTKERTAASWVAWRDDRVTQGAVAWVLTSVFIRFCEDNALVEPVWIAGPERRRQEALDAQLAFFRAHPEDTDREWLRSAIDYLAGLPATRALVGAHSALHLVSPSGDAVTGLLDFWRRRDDDGALIHDLADRSLSTRFLGDLYQDLSQHAKDTYALLQTPVFVEEFILDRTLEPALRERPLEGFKLVDPTCGSGHFLLGAFDRLLDRWHRNAPGLELQARVQVALDAIHGVDLNPFAVAIARFRLTVAALKACGLMSLEKAPAFTFHLAVGDSLIHGPDPGVFPSMADRTAFMPFTYTTEDGLLLLTMLEEGTYDVVVGNPPYITVKDKALNKIYRSKYANVCKGTYALTVPFMALFFALAKSGERAGWVGQITSNSFMKREFGSPLIETFLTRQDLRLIADTSGAYIPGHGTPTVIIVGRNQKPVGATVRAALGIRRDTKNPEQPSEGRVWRSIVDHVDIPGWDDGWITIVDLDRNLLSGHPWSLTGGAALMTQQTMKSNASFSLASKGVQVGGLVTTGEDSAYEIGAASSLPRMRVQYARQLVLGESVRDYIVAPSEFVIFPYAEDLSLVSSDVLSDEMKLLWPSRTTLLARKRFGKPVSTIKGFTWFEYRELYRQRLGSPAVAVFRKIATHNHAAMDRERRLFREACHGLVAEDSTLLLGVLAVLNSSTACFWLKQHSYDKGAGGIAEGVKAEGWEHFREFAGATLHNFPLPPILPAERGQAMDELARELGKYEPARVIADQVPTATLLAEACVASNHIRGRMIASQEELDWTVYRLYGLIDEHLAYSAGDLPELSLGERAFEIALAREVQANGERTVWFSRHGSIPITEIPAWWPSGYRELVQKRLNIVAANPSVGLLERPEYKRRWASEPWERRQERALRGWLLDRVEDRRFWFDAQGRPLPRSVAQLADEVSRDADVVSVLALWEGRPDVPVTQSLVRLLGDEAVPFLAAYRYKESGLRKREAWEQTWALQRREDAGERVGTIPVPPKYTSADFRKNSYWQARGKLDVPKERFILYPEAGRDTDPTPLLGWAGWDHAQQSLALSLIIGEREKDGWGDDRLIPLVAGLAEVQPWVEQWHGEVDPSYGVSLAAFCREQLTARAAQVGKTLAELAKWGPQPATRGRRMKSYEGTP
jgi:hypothetical protein